MRKLFFLLILVLAACSSTKSDTSTTTSSCSEKDFSYSVGVTEGAAGSAYTPLILTNKSAKECTLQGVPGGQPVLQGTPVGPASQMYQSQASNEPVTIKPGATASVLFVVAEASNYPSEQCVPGSADGIVLNFDNKSARFSARFELAGFQVCTKSSNTFVSSVVSGSGG